MTVFPYKQSPTQPFQFNPTLDGQVYTGIVTWSLFGKRLYLNLYALDGTPIICTAIAGSPTPVGIASLSWLRGFATATLLERHGYRVGSTVPLTVSGCTPDGYNGIVEATATDPMTIQYAVATDPGQATLLGAAGYDLNLIGGVPNIAGTPFTSTLVFRQAALQFEVSP